METAEYVGVTTENLQAEISRIECQLDRLLDIALSVNDRELEQDLRNLATNLRNSIDAMRAELEPAETFEFVA